jgi:hypothetical protein
VPDERMKTEPQEGAHASLQTLGDYDYARVKREFTEDHAKVWDIVRRCYAAEESGPPSIDVYRLAVKGGLKWFVALGFQVIDEGWIKFDERRASRLKDELPNPRALIEEAANEAVAVMNVSVEVREHVPPNPADLVRMMRDGRIGRPSTYARHVANVSDMIDTGYVTRNANGRYSVTELGRAALSVLRNDAFATVGVTECNELESDLERIESGQVTPFEVAIKHIGLVKNLSSPSSQAAPDTKFLPSAEEQERSVLPAHLDPERTLSTNHPLRLIKNRITAKLKRRDAASSNESRSAVRAAVAYAVAGLWRLTSEAAMLQELRYNLAYRWLCELRPEDIVWSDQVFADLVRRESPLVAELRSEISDVQGIRCNANR